MPLRSPSDDRQALQHWAIKFVVKTFDAARNPSVTATAGCSQQLIEEVSYIDHVDLLNKKLCKRNGIAPADAAVSVELFRRFPCSDSFYALTRPVIVCEGETDNTHTLSTLSKASRRSSRRWPPLDHHRRSVLGFSSTKKGEPFTSPRLPVVWVGCANS